MQPDEKILTRLDELIKMGERTLATYTVTPNQAMRKADLDPGLARQWAASCLNLLHRVCGIDSAHYQQFDSFNARIVFAFSANQVLGILKAAKDDYEQGMLFNSYALITAEVFKDFLEQAEHLLKMGYYQPAAVVAGAVLEDGLRKLCARHNVTVSPTAKVETMNTELTRASVYNGLVQKQVTMLADLRNKAAHGQWTEFTEAQVATMLPQVRAFMTQHFS